jgi:hypothetical protein
MVLIKWALNQNMSFFKTRLIFLHTWATHLKNLLVFLEKYKYILLGLSKI